MSIQELERDHFPTTSKIVKKRDIRSSSAMLGGSVAYEVVVTPDLGGTNKPPSALEYTTPIAEPSDRKSAPAEVQEPQFEPVKLAQDLVMGPIPNWDMAMEINCFKDNVNTELAKGKDLAEAVALAAKELEIDVRGYDAEIIKSKAVLLHSNSFEEVDGVVRMVGNNGKPIVDSVSGEERNGAVLEASQKIENSLVAATYNTVGVLVNPAGWNGYKDQYGRDVSPHRNAQILVFWKDQEGKLRGLTFHVDLKLDQTKKFMLSLGVSEEVLKGATEKEQIVNIVKNPAILSLPEAYDSPFMYVLDRIVATRGNQPFRLLQEKGEEIWSVDQVRADISRFEQLLQGNPEEEECITEMRNSILIQALRVREKEGQQEIVNQTRKALLSLTRIHLQKTGRIPVLPFNTAKSYPDTYSQLQNKQEEFAQEIAYLETRRGCPPSMANIMVLSGVSVGSESAVEAMPSTVTATELKDPDFCIRCGACGKYIWCVVKRGQKCPKCPSIREC